MAKSEWEQSVTARIGVNVAEARKVAGLSAAELSGKTEELGSQVPRQVIANLESGRRESVSVGELLILASALGVPALSLLVSEDQLDRWFPMLPPQSDWSGLLRGFEAAAEISGAAPSKRDVAYRMAEQSSFGASATLFRSMADAAHQAKGIQAELFLADQEAGADGDADRVEALRTALETVIRPKLVVARLLIDGGTTPLGALPSHEIYELSLMWRQHFGDESSPLDSDAARALMYEGKGTEVGERARPQ